jgi:hypothetical protein
MAPDRSDAAAPLECCLKEGLSALAGVVREVGAHCVSVILAENGGSIRTVYHWPDAAGAAGELHGGANLLPAVETWERPVAAESDIGQFLNQTAAPSASSFLLVPWPDQRWKVVIAFGFSSKEPVRVDIRKETSSTLHLAALATWIAAEIGRLHRELHVVSDRLGRRKLVERAKGLLQARHGWSEQRAYEHLRKLSRQQRKNMADTAQELLRVPPGT